MSLGYTTEKFIAKAKSVHGDKYDYSVTEYQGALKEVQIICPEHGIFEQVASKHLRGAGCKKCAVRKAQSQVISEFRAAHGDFYDYSLVKYISGKIHVKVICPIHGVFEIAPEHHANGVRCQKCAIEARKANKVYGIGINDSCSPTRTKSYQTWRDILGRCYSDKCLNRNPTYAGCTVCDEWLSYSNFKKWFDENYTEGYDLDKDLICKGNRVYAPDVCCFVPHRINSLIIGCDKARGIYPKGVSKVGNKYSAYLRRDGEAYRIGLYNTPEDAFAAYKTAKESYIKKVAASYYNEGKITKKVYNALMNYQVEITD